MQRHPHGSYEEFYYPLEAVEGIAPDELTEYLDSFASMQESFALFHCSVPIIVQFLTIIIKYARELSGSVGNYGGAG